MPAPPRHVLAFCTHGIGDVVMCLPLFHGLRAALPEARITALLRGPAQAEVFKGRGLGIELAFKSDLERSRRAMLAAVWGWRRSGVDVAIATHNVAPKQAAWLARAAGARRTVGFNRLGSRVRFTHPLQGQGEHKVDENRRILDVLGLPTGPAAPDWPVLEEEAAAADRVFGREGLGRRPVLGLTPGCTPHEHFKRWPVASYQAALRRVAQDLPFDLVIFGGPGEEDLAQPLVDAPPGPGRVVSLVGRLSLRETAACLGRCDAVLGGDCGLMHVAAALGRPSLVLMGPTQPGITAARGPRTTVLASPHDCVGCYERAMKIDPGCPAPQCMFAIEPARVADLLLGMFPAPRSIA